MHIRIQEVIETKEGLAFSLKRFFILQRHLILTDLIFKYSTKLFTLFKCFVNQTNYNYKDISLLAVHIFPHPLLVVL